MTVENKDCFVVETKDKNFANSIRSSINNNYKGIWVCVISDGNVYKISIANNWGGRLEKKIEDSIIVFVSKQINESKLPEKNKRVKITVDSRKQAVCE